MIAYPVSIDDAPIVLLDVWRTKKWTPHSTRALYHLLGVGLNMAFPDMALGIAEVQQALKAEGVEPMSDDDFGALLEDLAAGKTRGAIDWKSMISTILALIAKILSGV